MTAARAIDRVFAALADPARRRTVELLRQRPHRAGELADLLDLPAPAMSRHLRALRESGLVEERIAAFDARVRIYALRAAPLTELRSWIDTTETMWAAQLDAFRKHVEKRRK